jgi:protein-disulfide isomerase/uncharacterized membrane protein
VLLSVARVVISVDCPELVFGRYYPRFLELFTFCTMTIPSAHRPEIKPIVIGLSLLGLLFSAVALYQHVVVTHGLATGPSFCNISRHINCDAVNASPWSLFLGLPVAAYGLLFYLGILGLVSLSGSGRSVSAHKAYEVVLFLSLVASLVSLALFCISEFIIGALCLMCLGLYLTNFCLFGVAWWFSARGTLVSGVVGGVQNLAEFLLQALSGAPRALAGLVALLIAAVFAAFSPEVLVQLLGGKAAGNSEKKVDWVAQWRASPVVTPRISVGGGSFDDYAKGDLNAPIQIVEFADMECPGCREMYVALNDVLKDFEGQYHLVFKNFPLDQACNPTITEQFHLFACHATFITRCAGEQGKFWEALQLMFTDPSIMGEGESQDIKATLVKNAVSSLDLDGQALEVCIESGRYKSKIEGDVAEGVRLGLQSTPSFWINGKLVPHPSPEALTQVFQAVLAEKGVAYQGSRRTASAGE